MAHRDKYKYSKSPHRQADYLKKSYKGKGLTNEAAEHTAWVTLIEEGIRRKKELLRLQEEEENAEFTIFIERNGSLIDPFG